MNNFSNARFVAILLISGLFFFGGCKKSSEGGGGGSSSSSADAAGAISGTGDIAAVSATRDEIAKRWVATPDGWVSEFPSHIMIGNGKRADAESYYRQIKELKFEIETREISESDKLNGIQFRGYCTLHTSPLRLYNDPNSFGGKKWSEWRGSDEATSIFPVQKKNGQWSFPGDSFVITGEKPTPATMTQLK